MLPTSMCNDASQYSAAFQAQGTILLFPPTNLSEGWLSSPSAKPDTDAGMPYTTICDTPAGARPSGSNSSKAKLLVPSGTPDQARGGERFSPTQLVLLSHKIQNQVYEVASSLKMS